MIGRIMDVALSYTRTENASTDQSHDCICIREEIKEKRFNHLVSINRDNRQTCKGIPGWWLFDRNVKANGEDREYRAG